MHHLTVKVSAFPRNADPDDVRPYGWLAASGVHPGISARSWPLPQRFRGDPWIYPQMYRQLGPRIKGW